MLTIRETLAVFCDFLKKNFNVKISSQDITENFNRETFYIKFDNIIPNDYMKKFLEKDITVRIVYFPKNDTDNIIELLERQDELIKVFANSDVIKLKDGVYANINEYNTVIVDKTLHFDFEAYIFEEYDEVSHKTMEEIKL
ncbi:MAG: hypothetical protein SOR81_01080 [Fusobacterium sp.]|uniref:phage tail terminator family protein n=1 Tax=Fusobacterium sp. TaxID=68766 RepID=UPI002A7575F2|nr:hypothetical protein [Fusobacterium sp.]MDY2980192.1 hypothetical protein [Fusobacterium sp.]